MFAISTIRTVASVAAVVAVGLWVAPAFAQASPPAWWNQDDDRTTCVTFPFNTADEVPTPSVSADPGTDPPVSVETEGDAGWIDEVAGHSGVMGVEGAGKMGSVVIWVWNGEGDNSEKHVWLQYDSYCNQGSIGGPSLTAGPPDGSVGFHSPPPQAQDLGGGWSRHWREWTIKPQPFYEEIEFTMGTVPSGGSSAAAVIDNVQVGSHCENPPNPPNGKVCAFNLAEDVMPPDPVYVECTPPGHEATVWTTYGSTPPTWMAELTNHEGMLGLPGGLLGDGVLEVWVDDLAEPGGTKHVACQFDFYMAEGGLVTWELPEVPPECLIENFQEYVYELEGGWQRGLLKFDVTPAPDWETFRWHLFADEMSGPVAVDSLIFSSGYLFRDNWLEQFDVYDAGTGLHGQNGWKGWDNDPTLDAYVSDLMSRSIFNSVEVAGATDLVHESNELTEGRWQFSAWTYVPSDFQSGCDPQGNCGSYFILLNTYDDGGPHEDSDWSVQMNFDSNDGMLKVYYGNGMNTVDVPYIPEEWVEIDVVIDLDLDSCRVYYDSQFIAEYSWTGGVLGYGGGAQDIAAVDLYANGSTPVYYDDLWLKRAFDVGDVNCDGAINTFDIDPFVLALTNPGMYEEEYPACDVFLADIDGSGAVNTFDIDPFVALLTGG